jgi:hypothetical protein
MRLPFPTVRAAVKAAGRVCGRFPFVVISAAVATGASIMEVDASGEGLRNVVMAGTLGIPLMFSLRLLRERWLPDPIRGLLLEGAGILLVAGYFLSLPPEAGEMPALFWIRFLVLDAGLHFAVAFVPVMARAGETAFWQFNRRLFQRFALSALYSAVLFIGLSLAIASSDKLFSLGVNAKRYGELWLMMAGIFNTVFFLGGMPEGWDELQRDDSYPRGIRAFAQFALAPLVTVFVAILYAYLLKIVVAWAWPHGWVALPVCCLSVVGILAALLLEPARRLEDERWARWYWKCFFRALVPLSVLLLLSLKVRISEYGVTELRYYGIVVGAWLLAVSIYFTLRPRASTRSIPASLAALCFLSVAGPWGAFSISSASQKRQLLAVLAPFSAVEDGRLVPAKRALPLKDQASVRSILGHLIGTYGAAGFADLFAAYEASAKGPNHGNLDGANTYATVESLISFINGAHAAPANTGGNIHVSRGVGRGASRYAGVDLDEKSGLAVDGYRMLYHACVWPGCSPQKLGDLTIQFSAADSPPKITFEGKALDVAGVEALLAAIADAGRKGKRELPSSAMSARLVSGPREWLLIVDKFQASTTASGRPHLTELEIYLLEK